MVLKKRIRVKPRDMDEGLYRLAAEICPICGTNIREEKESYQFMYRDVILPPKLLYVSTRQKITFFCPTCGCSWSVKRFKNSKVEKKQ